MAFLRHICGRMDCLWIVRFLFILICLCLRILVIAGCSCFSFSIKNKLKTEVWDHISAIYLIREELWPQHYVCNGSYVYLSRELEVGIWRQRMVSSFRSQSLMWVTLVHNWLGNKFDQWGFQLCMVSSNSLGKCLNLVSSSTAFYFKVP